MYLNIKYVIHAVNETYVPTVRTCGFKASISRTQSAINSYPDPSPLWKCGKLPAKTLIRDRARFGLLKGDKCN